MPAPVPLLAARAVAKSFGGRHILEGADLDVAAGARIGVLGANGSGKSTLLRILAGLETADAGTVTRRRGLTWAHLPQLVEGDEHDALSTVLAARPELTELAGELERAEARLADPALAADLRAMERALARQAAALERWSVAGGDSARGEARFHLRELGLPDDAIAAPTRTLSGGQRKLVALAACLARRPDVLLLDEPEAHLDMTRRAHLEALIGGFGGAVVMVSHDRALLDATVAAIAELERGRIRMWAGGYSAYTVARELELQRQRQLFVTQQKEIARLEDAVRRFRHWAHITINERAAKQARVKQMQIDRMEKVERPVLERRRMALALRSAQRGGQRVIALEDVDAGYPAGGPASGASYDLRSAGEDQPPSAPPGDELVLAGVELVIGRGERVGVVGPNGGGKSTLLAVIAGELPALGGEVRVGEGIRLGVLSQAAELPRDRTVIDVVRGGRSLSEEAAVRALMAFRFDYEQVRRPVATLSGGERTRLALLLLMQDGANCLLLDEPTNHLDVDSIEALEGALEAYDGTVVAISHDRYFLDRIADRIVSVADGAVHAYEGGWSVNAAACSWLTAA
jgi:ATP-binding cassette subfamily F protein 3